MTEQLCS